MGRPRILVIDDEQALRETVADTLRMDGLDVQTARKIKATYEGRAGKKVVNSPQIVAGPQTK